VAEQTVTLRITSDASGAVSGVRKVRSEFDGIGSTSERSGQKATRALDTTGQGAERVGRQLAGAKRQVLGFVGAFIGLQSVGAVVSGIISNTLRQEAAFKQLETRVRSTGGAAGFAAPELASMAAELQTLTTYGDEAVMEMQSLLLTFTQIGGSEFQRAQLAILDTATAMGTDLKSAALQLGKALNDPIEGLSALARSGIQFTDQQKDVIKQFVETGRVAEAQGVILDELQRQFGGAAVAARDTLGGALASLKNALGDLLEAKGGLPEVRGAVEAVVQQMQSPEVAAGFDTLVSAFVGVIPVILDGLASAINAIGRFSDEIAAAIRLGVQLAPVLLAVWGAQLLRAVLAYSAQLVFQAQQYVINIALARTLGIAQAAGMLASLKSIGLVTAALGGLVALFAGWQIGTWLREEFEVVQIAGNALVAGFFNVWNQIEFGAKVAFAALAFAAVASIDVIRNKLAELIESYVDLANIDLPLGLRADFTFGAGQALTGLASELRNTGAATAAAAGEVERLRGEWAQADAANIAMMDDMMQATEAQFAHRDATDAAADATADLTGKTGALKAGVEKASGAIATAAQDTQQWVAGMGEAGGALQSLARILDRQAVALGGPAVAAAQSYRDQLAAISEIEQQLVAGNSLSVEAVDDLAKARKQAFEELAKDLRESGEAVEEVGRTFEDVLADLADTGLNRLITDIELVGNALDKELARGGPRVAELKAALRDLHGTLGPGIVEATSEALRGMQSLASQGSASFRAMQVAIDALALVQGISAVLNQGTGDPYSAPVRMSLMAAAIAPLIANLAGSIGSFGGSAGFTDTAARRQEQQGTGSVLGDAAAKSESILNALEITADATSELVGINRGMLRALIALQNGLDSAGGMLARGAGQSGFADLPAATRFGDVFMGGALRSLPLDPLNLLGGSSRITDQGIVIMGNILEGIVLGAFQEVQSRSWRFGSRRTSEEIVNVSGGLEAQFQLVIDSLVNTVREGALALGLLPAEIEAALAAFQLEEIRISLKDLTAEEQQAELLAVFSSIFDGLAGAVVPFIAQFQRVGEGLGETLVRVATGVQVTQEGLRRLGFSLDEIEPERFAQISESLIDLVGGIEEFVSGMLSFVDKFAPESRKFELLQSDLTRAFEQSGLTIPATRQGMFELMQSLDATTESGREQIATLLRLADTADAYYTMLERGQAEAQQALEAQVAALQDYAAMVADLREELGSAGMSEFALEIRSIGRWTSDTIEALTDTARAAGMQSAAEEDLGLVHLIAAQRAAAAIERLRQSAADLVGELFGTPLDQVTSQIAEIEAAQRASTDTQIGAINDVGAASAAVYQQQLAALQGIQDWLDSQLLGDLSSLTPEQRLAEARRQFDAAATAAAGGDVNALQRITQLADTLLREERSFSASFTQFGDTEAYVRDRVARLLEFAPVAGPGAGAPGAGSVGGSVGGSAGVSPELQALYDQRDAMLDDQLTEQRAEMMRQLGLMIRELIQATGDPLADVAASIGLNLTELAGALGINLDELSVETASSLAAMAAQLGVDVTELARNVGVELGTLADRQSLLNQALDATLAGVPADLREQLAGPLDAIRSATSDADSTLAVEEAERAINAMPAGIRDLLAPFFSNISPTPIVTELTTLRDINATASLQLDALVEVRGLLGRIVQNLGEANTAAGLPSYAVGSGFVPRTGPALIHQGEIILPAAVAQFARGSGLSMGPAAANSSDAVVRELRELRAEQTRSQGAIVDRLAALETTHRDGASRLAAETRRTGDLVQARGR